MWCTHSHFVTLVPSEDEIRALSSEFAYQLTQMHSQLDSAARQRTNLQTKLLSLERMHQQVNLRGRRGGGERRGEGRGVWMVCVWRGGGGVWMVYVCVCGRGGGEYMYQYPECGFVLLLVYRAEIKLKKISWTLVWAKTGHP